MRDGCALPAIDWSKSLNDLQPTNAPPMRIDNRPPERKMPINRPETAQISTIASKPYDDASRLGIVELRAVKTPRR